MEDTLLLLSIPSVSLTVALQPYYVLSTFQQRLVSASLQPGKVAAFLCQNTLLESAVLPIDLLLPASAIVEVQRLAFLRLCWGLTALLLLWPIASFVVDGGRAWMGEAGVGSDGGDLLLDALVLALEEVGLLTVLPVEGQEAMFVAQVVDGPVGLDLLPPCLPVVDLLDLPQVPHVGLVPHLAPHDAAACRVHHQGLHPELTTCKITSVIGLSVNEWLLVTQGQSQ